VQDIDELDHRMNNVKNISEQLKYMSEKVQSLFSRRPQAGDNRLIIDDE
jgi:hypothetical protein